MNTYSYSSKRTDDDYHPSKEALATAVESVSAKSQDNWKYQSMYRVLAIRMYVRQTRICWKKKRSSLDAKYVLQLGFC